MRCVVHWAIGVTAVGLFISSAQAGFSYTSATRTVTANASTATSSGGTQTFTATNFLPFNQTASSVDSVNNGFAHQNQNSQLLPSEIDVAGTFSGQRPALAGSGSASGQTTANISFSVSTTTDFALDAIISLNDGINNIPQGPRIVSLTGPSGTLVSWPINLIYSPAPWTGSRSTTLTLAPGSYTLLVDLHSFIAGLPGPTLVPTTVPNYNVSLKQVPEPAAMLTLLAATPLLASRRRVHTS